MAWLMSSTLVCLTRCLLFSILGAAMKIIRSIVAEIVSNRKIRRNRRGYTAYSLQFRNKE